MKQRTVFIMALATMFLFISVMTALSGPGKHSKCMGMGQEGMPMHNGMGPFGWLNLSDEQKDSIDEVLLKYKAQRETLMKNADDARVKVREAVHADVYDEANLRTAIQTAAAAKEELIVLKAKVFNEIKPILTAEQIAQLKERRENRLKGDGPGGPGFYKGGKGCEGCPGRNMWGDCPRNDLDMDVVEQ